MEPGPLVVQAADSGLIVLAHRRRDGVQILEALEATWGLGCPLIGRDHRPLVAALAATLGRRADWDLAILPGLPLGSPLLEATAAALAGRYRLAAGPLTRRHVASLAGGVDGFLSRRSPGLRKSLRRAARRAAAESIAFEYLRPRRASAIEALMARSSEVERRSWKHRVGGLAIGSMREFYRRMAGRLAETGRLRWLFASRGGEDVAYVLGAVFGNSYRGLQFSFDDRYRAIGLGNLAQLRQIQELAGEPGITGYDLGTGGDYKRSWAEGVRDSAALVVVRS
jgi:hypothetical protein